MNVLVVDDEPGVQEFVRLALLREGVTCRAAYSAEHALKLAVAQWPDLLVIDLGLPGTVDGWRLWEALAEEARQRPLRVIVLAGHVTGVAYAEAVRRGAAAVIGKPVTQKRLLRAVRQALDGDLLIHAGVASS
jgi:DNA-binding NtrC family response regulator